MGWVMSVAIDTTSKMEIGWTKQVLDKGYVKLSNRMGSDEYIVECARMSTGGGFVSWAPYRKCKNEACGFMESLVVPCAFVMLCRNLACNHDWVNYPDGDLGMLRHMMREAHSSPYEFGELVVEVKGPLMVYREWQRHRTQTYSEASARYTKMCEDHYVPDPKRIQKQSKTNKQASGDGFLEEDAQIIVELIETEQDFVWDNYGKMLDRGVAREIARINTPVSRYSVMRAKANLLNWLRFLKLRLAPNAQWEIQEYARAVEEIVRATWPRIYALFEEYDLYATRFSRSELVALKAIVGAFEEKRDITVGALAGGSYDALYKKVMASRG